jgi:predicted acetyltransferase
MVLEISKDRAIGAEQYRKIIRFLVYCYQKPELPEEKEKKYFAKTKNHFILKENEKIVSYLRIVLRKSDQEGKTLIIGGIGDVSTHPSFRRRGLAGLLINTALKNLTEAGSDIVLIFTDVKKMGSYYEKFGFHPFDRTVLAKDRSGQIRVIKNGTAMIKILDKNFDRILKRREGLYIGKGSW